MGRFFSLRVSIQGRWGREGELIRNSFCFFSQALRKTAKVVICQMTTPRYTSTMLRLMRIEKNVNTIPCTMEMNCFGEFTHFQWSPFLEETASTRKQWNFFMMG